MEGFLKLNTRLQALSIHASPAHTAALVKTAHISPSVQSITLTLPVTVSVGGGDFSLQRGNVDAPLSLPPWGELDHILSALPSLQKLQIAYLEAGDTLGERDITWIRFAEISACILEVLPLCAARGIVTQSVVAQMW